MPRSPPMSGNRPRQCRRGVSCDDDVELDAAMALADMAGVAGALPQQDERAAGGDEEEETSTRLSLELGKVGIQGAAAAASSSCSSAGGCPTQHQQQQVLPAVAAPGVGCGTRPRHSTLTEAEKEAKRLRRVLANRESARQTILRRQAIRDELARKVADLSSQNESMKKEKELVMQEYLTLQETNKKLKEQAVAKAATAMDIDTEEAPARRAEGNASSPAPHPGFLYTTAGPPAMPVPYAWGSWPPGYDPRVGDPAGPAPACVHPSFPGPSGTGGGGTAGEEDTEDDDDPCSLTLGLDVSGEGGSRADKAEARRRRKEFTRTKQPHGGARPGED